MFSSQKDSAGDPIFKSKEDVLPFNQISPRYRPEEIILPREMEWREIKETCNEDVWPEVQQLLDRRESVLLEGGAGTGKSTTTRRILRYFDEASISYETLAPTHAPARQLPSCDTLAHFCHRRFRNGKIPKISMYVF